MNKNYIFKNMRISILKDDILRFEYSPTGNFTNDETLFIDRKKEIIFSLEIGQQERIWFNYKDLVVVFDYDNPFRSIEIYQNDNRVYKFKGISNSGELPLPNKTPFIFPIMDAPRIIIPSEGYSEEASFIYEKDTKDLFLLIARNDYKKLRKQYISLTGHPEMMRKKNFGLFNSRYYAYSEKSAKEMIEKYKKHHIPLDNIVLDTDWRVFDHKKTEGTGYDINTKLFPDLARFFRFAHNHNVEVMMNDHPAPYDKHLNVLAPEEIKFRKENLTKFLVMGLDTWWYDRNWFVKLNTVSKRVAKESLGRYIYHDITKQFYQGLVLDPEVYIRPVTLTNITEIKNGEYVKIKDSRSHIYPFQWSGDISSDAGVITSEIKNMNRCSNNMLAYYSSDIGGHTSNPSRIEFIRWYQYGAFSPILRPHCTCSVNRFREPWVFGEKTENIVKEYISMRYRLLGEIYTNAYKHYEDGLGIYRPLYLNYPNDKKVYKENTSYMLGDKILISPIGGGERRKVPLSFYKGSIYASYYLGRELKGKALLSRKEKDIHIALDEGEQIEDIIPSTDFSARYKFRIKPDRDIDLYVTSDDGVRVTIDDKKVLNDWNCHAEITNHVSSMKKNTIYKVTLEYFQAGGGASLRLYYCPTIKNKKTKIYLPSGEWYNLSHRNVYKGNRYLKERFKEEEMPLFVKAGSLIPLYKEVSNISKMSFKNIIYDYYPSKEVSLEDYLYEDDGVTTGYKVCINRISKYKTEFKDNCYIVTLFKSNNNLDDRMDFRLAALKMHVRDKEKVTKVTINDTEVRFKRHDHNKNIYPFSSSEWARDSKTCYFRFKQDIRKEYVIKIYVK